jgi:hypothetical protein
MPLQNLVAISNVITGLVTDRRDFETPGFLVDLSTYEPLIFGVNPTTQRRTKELIVTDHIIPGRHSPLQEPVSGGAEVLAIDLLFYGSGDLAMAATKQAVHWLESLCFPDRGGALAAIGNLLTPGASDNRSVNFVSGVGHRVSLTDGAWIIERPYLLRRIETTSGPGHHPLLRLPYRAICRLTLQEDEVELIDYVERRWGMPSFG